MSPDSDPQQRPESPAPRPPLPTDTLCYAFEKLADGAALVEITFEGQIYRLQKTRNGRLILTK